MIPLFPAIKAECLVVLHAPTDTVRVVVDWHDDRVDVEAFIALAIVELLKQGALSQKDPNKILDLVIRMANGRA